MAPELQYGVPTDVWSERALTKTFRCPPEVVMQQRHDRVTGRQRQAYGGDKPCLKICDIWDRSPTAKATVKSSSGETGLHSFGHPGFRA
jgi:hypothetical protein